MLGLTKTWNSQNQPSWIKWHLQESSHAFMSTLQCLVFLIGSACGSQWYSSIVQHCSSPAETGHHDLKGWEEQPEESADCCQRFGTGS